MKKVIPLMFINLLVCQISNATISNNYESDPDNFECYEVAVHLFTQARDVLGVEQAIETASFYYEDCINGEFD